jgi:hypothetical protein
MKSILQHPAFAHRTFSFDVLPPATEAKGKETLKLYSAIPSIEIWNNESINSIISQIEYYRESGYFKSDKDVEVLYESVQQTIEHLRRQADSGCKFMPGQSPELKQENFQLFQNRLILGDNTILVLQNGNKTLYLNHDVLNYMITKNEKFCEEVYQKMLNMMRRATLLSHVSEKQRQMFFNGLLRKIPKRQSTISVNATKP